MNQVYFRQMYLEDTSMYLDYANHRTIFLGGGLNGRLHCINTGPNKMLLWDPKWVVNYILRLSTKLFGYPDDNFLYGRPLTWSRAEYIISTNTTLNILWLDLLGLCPVYNKRFVNWFKKHHYGMCGPVKQNKVLWCS